MHITTRALGCVLVSACQSPGAADPPADETGGIFVVQDPGVSGEGETTDDARLDLPPPETESGGCSAVDLLFVLDNSASMQTHHAALAAAFPGFITATIASLPPGTDLHVGLTTTDVACKDPGCDCPDATIGCQSAAASEAILSVYAPPKLGHNGVNGSQGRLLTFDQVPYFSLRTDQDPDALIAWFTANAGSVGEHGCSFEMPVAAAGFVADPINEPSNHGFLRDENTALIVFVLTDEPDKSPEPVEAALERLRAAKQGCGGDVCITTAGLLPPCLTSEHQSLWRFLSGFGESPVWGDIHDPAAYGMIVERALAEVSAQACAAVPVL